MHTLNKILKNFEKHSGRIGPDVWGNDYLLHECTFGGGGSGKKSEVGYAVSVFGVKDGKEEEDVSRRYMLPVSIDCLFDGLVEPEGDTSDVACGLFCATVEAMGKRKDTKNVYSILTRLIDAYEKARKMPDEERKLITENIVDIIKDMPALEGKEFGYEVRDKSSVSIVGLEQGMYKIGENVLDRTVLGSEAFDYLMQVAMIDRARWFAAAELAYKVDFERASRTFNDIAKRNGPEVKQIVGRKMRYNKDISCFSVLRDAAIDREGQRESIEAMHDLVSLYDDVFARGYRRNILWVFSEVARDHEREPRIRKSALGHLYDLVLSGKAEEHKYIVFDAYFRVISNLKHKSSVIADAVESLDRLVIRKNKFSTEDENRMRELFYELLSFKKIGVPGYVKTVLKDLGYRGPIQRLWDDFSYFIRQPEGGFH